MKTERFLRRSRIEAPADAVFAWHVSPGALERLIPPGDPMRVLETTGEIGNGARAVFRIRLGPIPVRWVAEHKGLVPGREFTDVQVSGPLAFWEHRHLVEPDGPSACFLEDRIDYALPLGWAGRVLASRFVRRKLERLFAYRHRITAEAFRAAQ
jgi:ligand-binding SRPBCC domain-containing protein